MPVTFSAEQAVHPKEDTIEFISATSTGSSSGSARGSSVGFCWDLEKSTPVEETVAAEGESGSVYGEWRVKNTFLNFVDERTEARSRAVTSPGVICTQVDELPSTLPTPIHSPQAVPGSDPYSLPEILDLGSSRDSQPAPALATVPKWLQHSWPGGCFTGSAPAALPYYGMAVPFAPSASGAVTQPPPGQLGHHQPAIAAAVEARERTPQLAGPGVPTAGSAFHYKGRCKPCAFVWKVQGCENGQDCKFCHLCGPDELQNRKRAKKERFAAARQRKAARAAAAAASAPCESLAEIVA